MQVCGGSENWFGGRERELASLQTVTEASGLITKEPRMSQSPGNTENARIEKV